MVSSNFYAPISFGPIERPSSLANVRWTALTLLSESRSAIIDFFPKLIG